MRHVARAAGVSVMTVSLALRRAPSIPEATRERVLAAAAAVGYRKNPLVSVLMAGLRSRRRPATGAQVIAYVESYADGATRQQADSLRRFRAGVNAGAARHGYGVERFRLGESGLGEVRLEQILSARGIRGVVFGPFPQMRSKLELPWSNHALAAVGFSLAVPAVHRAVNHHSQSIRLALRELVALGYRRIGVALRRHEDERANRNWLSSVLLARHDSAGTATRFPLWVTDEIARSSFQAWLKRERPAVVLGTDRELQAMLRGTGIGFAHLHLTPDMAGWSGIDQNNEQVAAAAVELVVEQLHSNQFGPPEAPKTVLIEGRWVVGRTAPGPRTSARAS